MRRLGFIPINISVGIVGLLVLSGIFIYLIYSPNKFQQTSSQPVNNSSPSVQNSPPSQTMGDPIIYSVAPNQGSLRDIKVMIIRGTRFNPGPNSVYFENDQALFSIIHAPWSDGQSITINPCDNRTASDCARLEAGLGQKFEIVVQRPDGRKSNGVEFTLAP